MNDIIQNEIEAFDAMKVELEMHHLGKFVILKGGVLVGAFDTFDAAAQEAIRQFPNDKFLIRQVGIPATVRIPASVAWQPLHASR